MIYFLLISLIVLLFFCLFLFDRDILSPSVILCAVYILSTFCAIYNIKKWDVNLHTNTYCVIIIGLLSFIVIEFMIRQIFKSKSVMLESKPMPAKLNYINVQPVILIITIGVFLIISFLYLKEVKALAGRYGANLSDITSLMSTFRAETSYGEDSLPLYISQLFKIMRSAAYVLVAVFINNIIVCKKIKPQILLIIPVIIYAVTSLMGANRTGVLSLFVIILIISYILLQRNCQWSIKTNFKYVKNVIVAFGVFLFLFSYFRQYVGRLNQLPFLEYVTTYIGGSIQLLDAFMQQKHELVPFSKWESLLAFYNNLSKFGLVQVQSPHLEFGSSNGVLIGNVYTAFRKYFHDLGWVGVIFFQVLYSAFISTFYCRLKHTRKKNFLFKVIIYSFFAYTLFLHSVQEEFFSDFMCLNSVVTIILIYIFYKFYTKLRFKIKR